MNLENVREEAVGRGLHLEYLTVGWNILEGLIAVGSGLVAGSIALVGFGIDSMIEVSSGTILIWRLVRDRDLQCREKVEAVSLKLVGGVFSLSLSTSPMKHSPHCCAVKRLKQAILASDWPLCR